MSLKKLKITLPDGEPYTVTVEDVIEDIAPHIIGLEEYRYVETGSQIRPVVVTDGTVELNKHYIVEYGENKEIGMGSVTVTGVGFYENSVHLTFEIVDSKQEIEPHIYGLSEYEAAYTGEQITPYVITDGTVGEGQDFTVEYGPNVEEGTGYVFINGINTYKGFVQLTFDIIDFRENISMHVMGIDKEVYEYTGEQIKPELITDGFVVEGEDYTVEYGDNVEEGEGTVVVNGINNFKGSALYTFSITDDRESIVDHIVSLEKEEYDWTGEQIKPVVIDDESVTLDEDYIVTYGDNVEEGEGIVTVKGINTYKGTKILTFTIVDSRESIVDHITGLEHETYDYTGEQIKPVIITDESVTLDEDYTVEYGENINPEEAAYATVKGINSYKGIKTLIFTINDIREEINTHVTGIEQTEYEWTGEQIKPVVTTDGTVTEDVDYTITYGSNIHEGQGTVTVTGINMYKGSETFTFEIIDIRDDISMHVTGIEQTEYTYTGEQIKPVLITDDLVVLDQDYTIEYGENIENEGTVLVSGIGACKGTALFNFTIIDTREEISAHVTGIVQTAYEYTGEKIKPELVTDGSVELETDYTVEYGDNTEIGEGTVTVTGVGSYKGNVTYIFEIIGSEPIPEEEESAPESEEEPSVDIGTEDASEEASE